MNAILRYRIWAAVRLFFCAVAAFHLLSVDHSCAHEIIQIQRVRDRDSEKTDRERDIHTMATPLKQCALVFPCPSTFLLWYIFVLLLLMLLVLVSLSISFSFICTMQHTQTHTHIIMIRGHIRVKLRHQMKSLLKFLSKRIIKMGKQILPPHT